MPTWDPDRYLRFDDARTRPARDLLAAVSHEGPGTVVDVGCGPGNSTALLARRWPEARLIGLDASPEMLDRAREAVPSAELVQADLTTWTPPEAVDVVFCNATLQWVENHGDVFDHLLGWLGPTGTLAVQMPANFDQPSHVEMRRQASSPPWADRLGGVLREQPVATPAEYHRQLSDPGREVDIWLTEYLHVLTGPDPVVGWVRGTGLRPVLDLLSEEDRREFLAAYAARMRRSYPPQEDGTTLFPFRRIFVVVRTAQISR